MVQVVRHSDKSEKGRIKQLTVIGTLVAHLDLVSSALFCKPSAFSYDAAGSSRETRLGTLCSIHRT